MLSRDGVAGLICLALSVWLLLATRHLPAAQLVPIGPAFYPRLVVGLLAVCSVVLVAIDLLAWRRRAAAGPAAAAVNAVTAPQTRPNYILVLLTFVIFGVYIFLLPGLGFRIATFLFVLALQVTLEWPTSPRKWALAVVVAFGTAAVCHLIFEDYLSVLLPRGRWSAM